MPARNTTIKNGTVKTIFYVVSLLVIFTSIVAATISTREQVNYLENETNRVEKLINDHRSECKVIFKEIRETLKRIEISVGVLTQRVDDWIERHA